MGPKDPDGAPGSFRGFGLFFFRACSQELFALKGRWTHHEEKFLEIDTLELVAGNIALQALVETLESAGYAFVTPVGDLSCGPICTRDTVDTCSTTLSIKKILHLP